MGNGVGNLKGKAWQDGGGSEHEYREGDWVWCLHCGRVYQAGEFRAIAGVEYCPYEGCDGTTVLDGIAWEIYVMEGRAPELVAVRGKVYDLW